VLGSLEKEAFFKTLVPVRHPSSTMCWSSTAAAPRRARSLPRFDQRLRQAHHYHHARELGQLAAPRVCVAADAAELATSDLGRRGIQTR